MWPNDKWPKPSDIQRTFASNNIVRHYTPKPGKNKRIHRSTFWPSKHLNYDFLDNSKQIVCTVPHPNYYYKHQQAEYRLSKLYWSRGSYVDLRLFKGGIGTGTGILLHIDVLSEILPYLIQTVRDLQNEDTRDPDTIQKVVVYPSDYDVR